MRLRRTTLSFLSLSILVLTAACNPVEAAQTATLTYLPPSTFPVMTPTLDPAESQVTRQTTPAEATRQPSPAVALQSTPTGQTAPTPCPPDLCVYSAQFFLRRPVSLPGNDISDVTYRFGSTQGKLRDPHHGVEFLNPYGTPVQAAGDGVVVVAGEDRQPTSPRGVWPITFYGPYSYFYGNLVVIEHQAPEALRLAIPDLPQPIYTLYAHLSEILVTVGQPVETGQEIGRVGMTGVATGNHLHFEVRLGGNTYKSSRNPELWLAPRLDPDGQLMGAIAGKIINQYGTILEMDDVVLEHLPGGPDQPKDFDIHLQTYQEKALIGQPPWGESFGTGDLPAGWYRITFPYFGVHEFMLQVFPGQLTVVTIRAN